MNYLRHLKRSKNWQGLLKRLWRVWWNFGLTREKSVHALDRILEIARSHEWKPTFFVTASLLDHHARSLEKVLLDSNHIGLHGNHHVDLAMAPYGAQAKDIKAGLEKFRDFGVEVSGFRGPFLRSNGETDRAAAENGISWVSHTVMLLSHEAPSVRPADSKAVWDVLRSYYAEKSHTEYPSIPCWGEHCLEIPVSLPDDEMLVDRLGVEDPREIASVWRSMWNVTHRNGELLNLLYHPERIAHVADALQTILRDSAAAGDIWVASLDAIAAWWRKRAAFSFAFQKDREGSIRGLASCTPDASIVLQLPGGGAHWLDFDEDHAFEVPASVKPVIAFTDDCCPAHLEWLRNEGFALEPHGSRGSWAFVLDDRGSLNHRQLLEVLAREAKGPLVRYGRWPSRFRSAVAVSADVDAITIWDFFLRAWHFFRARSVVPGPAGTGAGVAIGGAGDGSAAGSCSIKSPVEDSLIAPPP